MTKFVDPNRPLKVDRPLEEEDKTGRSKITKLCEVAKLYDANREWKIVSRLSSVCRK